MASTSSTKSVALVGELFNFDEGVEFDLHDLATLLLHERLTLPNKLSYYRLVETGDFRKIHKDFKEIMYIPPEQAKTLPIYFLAQPTCTPKESDRLASTRHFLLPKGHRGIKRYSRSPNPKVLELMYWKILHHLFEPDINMMAMQIILDVLPASFPLRVRTSKGRAFVCTPQSFRFAELRLHRTDFPVTVLSQIIMSGGEIPGPHTASAVYPPTNEDTWKVMLFDDPATSEKKRSVALDLCLPFFDRRGLGGEIFALENLKKDYCENLISDQLCADVVTADRLRYKPIARLPYDNIPVCKEALLIARGVLRRLEKIMRREENFCAYCGEKAPKAKCFKCTRTKFCDAVCRSSAMPYHKYWCKVDGLEKKNRKDAQIMSDSEAIAECLSEV